tara:strand:- start:32 stop:901 length:870 start_codon:yes stop_codon:yes gene_type:complete
MPVKKVVKKVIKKYSDLTPEGFLKPQVKLPKSFKKPKVRVGAAEDFIDKMIAKGKKGTKSKTKKAAGGVIKKITKKVTEGIKKRGRKSKRGRPKKKVETPVVAKKKQDPFKITKQKGESAEDFKKRKAAINKLRKQQEKEMAKEMGTKKPSEKDRTEKSMIKPPLKREMSKARRRRLVMQRLMGTNPKTGESKDIGRMGFPISETMRDLGYTGSRKGGLDLTEEQLRNMGFQIKKAGGALKDIPAGNKGLPNLPTAVRNKMGFKKMGGRVQKRAGGGMALRGLGATRKK